MPVPRNSQVSGYCFLHLVEPAYPLVILLSRRMESAGTCLISIYDCEYSKRLGAQNPVQALQGVFLCTYMTINDGM